MTVVEWFDSQDCPEIPSLNGDPMHMLGKCTLKTLAQPRER
jgi:hypothetical protein